MLLNVKFKMVCKGAATISSSVGCNEGSYLKSLSRNPVLEPPKRIQNSSAHSTWNFGRNECINAYETERLMTIEFNPACHL